MSEAGTEKIAVLGLGHVGLVQAKSGAWGVASCKTTLSVDLELVETVSYPMSPSPGLVRYQVS